MAERWTEKYSPRKVQEVVGQGPKVDEFMEWYEDWEPGDDAVLLHGGPGTGKTALVEALAEEEELDLIEINASDARNKDAIEELLGSAAKQQSLFRRGKIILVDEIDGLSGRSDRGGVGAVRKIIKESRFPVVLTANDAYDSKLRSLRSDVEMIEFGKVHLNSMTARMRDVCEEEGIEYEKDALKQIARSAGGDMRAALTDLETLASDGEVTKDELDELGYREQEDDVFEALKIIFKTGEVLTSVRAIDGIDKDPDEIFWWLEQNIPSEYEKPGEVARAFDALSRADVFQSRIHKYQNWRFKKYMIDTMCGGVALAKEEKYRKFTRYSPPSRFRRYGRTRSRRNKMEEICSKLSPALHVSPRIIRQEYLYLFEKVLESNEEFREQLIALGLEEDEIELLGG